MNKLPPLPPSHRPHLVKPHLSDYLVGFVLAVVLTTAPFTVVAFNGWGVIDRGAVLTLVAIFATIQAIVQVRYFLHWSSSRAPVEVSISIGFVAIVSAIIIGGAVWVMSDLHIRMMP